VATYLLDALVALAGVALATLCIQGVLKPQTRFGRVAQIAAGSALVLVFLSVWGATGRDPLQWGFCFIVRDAPSCKGIHWPKFELPTVDLRLKRPQPDRRQAQRGRPAEPAGAVLSAPENRSSQGIVTTGLDGPIGRLAISSDEALVALYSSQAGQISVLSGTTMKVLTTFDVGKGMGTCRGDFRIGKELLSVDRGCGLTEVWNWRTKRRIVSRSGYQHPLIPIESSIVIAGAWRNPQEVTGVSAFSESTFQTNLGRGGRPLGLSTDGRSIVVERGGNVSVFDPAIVRANFKTLVDVAYLRRLSDGGVPIGVVSTDRTYIILRNGRAQASAYDREDIVVVEASQGATPALRARCDVSEMSQHSDVVWTTNGRDKLICLEGRSTIAVYSTGPWRQLVKFDVGNSPIIQRPSFQYSSGKSIGLFRLNGTYEIFDLGSGKRRGSIPPLGCGNATVKAVCSPVGAALADGTNTAWLVGEDGKLRVWRYPR
jgi:hypothetical protein